MDPLDTMMVAAERYAEAQEVESRLRIEREETEAQIAASLLGNLNPATDKPHSDTSAKEAAKQCEPVMKLRGEILVAERQTILARAAYDCARIRAWQTVPAGVAA